MKNYITKGTVLAVAFLASSACSSAKGDDQVKSADVKQKATHNHSKVHPAGNYRKPSAAIYFDFDHSGVTPMGVSDIVELKVRDEYPGAMITYKILTTEGLNYFGPSEITMGSTALSGVNAIAPGDKESSSNGMNLQIQPLSEGAHKLTVIATANLANGQSIVRSQTIPIYTGEEFKPSKSDVLKARESIKTSNTSGGLVIMDAEETIED